MDHVQPDPSSSATFPWVPIYEELADVVLQHRERQGELLAALSDLAERGNKVVLLTDRDSGGERIPLEVIDPFTFFASFNRTSNYEDRSAVLAYLKDRYGLASPVPSSFDGVPIVTPQASWFFSYAADREGDDVDALWDLAQGAVAAADSEGLPVALFDRCLRVRSVGRAKLTMGLYWLAPRRYLPLDANTTSYLAKRGLWTSPQSGLEYVELLGAVRERLPSDFPAISYAAYEEMEHERAGPPPDVAIDEGVLALAVEQTIRPVLIGDNALYDKREGYHHDSVIPKASALLSLESLQEDPVAAVQGALAESGNLLSWQEVDKAHALLDHVDPAAARDALLDFFDGGDPLAERLRRFLDWGGPRELPEGKTGALNGTVASYLLAVRSPETVAFCKPDTYRRATIALLGRDHVAADPVDRVLHASRFYAFALRLFQEQHGLPFRDLMHVHIAFYLMQTDYHGRPTWDQLQPASGTSDAERVEEPHAAYSVADAAEGLFVDGMTFQDWLDVLRAKRNAILQGPPGVGKTFVAKRLAYALMGERAPERVEMVQFHQAYTYEDFVQGYRPHPDGGFVLRRGPFYRFCERARRSPDQAFVFIIDEVNRGNLSKIFGELMMLIEPDKRGPEWAIPLTYGSGELSPSENGPHGGTSDRDALEDRFYVPGNVYLLGMMNTADRSLALVDYALRRRFGFVTMEPRFEDPRFRAHLLGLGARGALVDRVVDRMGALNAEIREDRTNLGAGFCVGHSYFCAPGEAPLLDEAWYHRVVDREIAPLIREYWFDQPKKAEDLVAMLTERAAAVPSDGEAGAQADASDGSAEPVVDTEAEGTTGSARTA